MSLQTSRRAGVAIVVCAMPSFCQKACAHYSCKIADRQIGVLNVYCTMVFFCRKVRAQYPGKVAYR